MGRSAHSLERFRRLRRVRRSTLTIRFGHDEIDPNPRCLLSGFRDRARPRPIARRAIFGSVSDLVVIIRQLEHHLLSFSVFHGIRENTRASLANFAGRAETEVACDLE